MMTVSSLSSLVKDIRSCNICDNFLPAGPRPIVQVNQTAKILIVGQAPGSKVHATGIPFDDPSGDRLRDWMGIDKSTFYDASKIAIVPMGFCYPGTGKSGDLAPRRECADNWRVPLLKMLSSIELTLIIGQYAIEWHLNDTKKKTLTETVKSWQTYWPQNVVLPHPSPRNNIWLKKNEWFTADVLPKLKSRVQQLL